MQRLSWSECEVCLATRTVLRPGMRQGEGTPQEVAMLCIGGIVTGKSAKG